MGRGMWDLRVEKVCVLRLFRTAKYGAIQAF